MAFFWLNIFASFLSALVAYLILILLSFQCDQYTVICKIFEPYIPFVMILLWLWLPIMYVRNHAIGIALKLCMILWSLVVTGAAILLGAAHSYVLFN
jgi:hypothetical protein